jgi:hypothetical protein
MFQPIFNNSKYFKWYSNIIKNAKNRQKNKNTYYEKHHIIPRSLDGDNKKINLVALTAKEHFICHLLLPYCCISSKHKAKMVYAYIMLSKN